MKDPMTSDRRYRLLIVVMLVCIYVRVALIGAESWPTPPAVKMVKSAGPPIAWISVNQIDAFSEGGAGGCSIIAGGRSSVGVTENADQLRILIKAARVWPNAPPAFIQVTGSGGTWNIRADRVAIVTSRGSVSSDGFNTEVTLEGGEMLWVKDSVGTVAAKTEAATSAAPPDGM